MRPRRNWNDRTLLISTSLARLPTDSGERFDAMFRRHFTSPIVIA